MQGELNVLTAKVFLLLGECKFDFTHLQRVLHLLAQHLVGQADEDAELGVGSLVVLLDDQGLKTGEVLVVRKLGDEETALV